PPRIELGRKPRRHRIDPLLAKRAPRLVFTCERRQVKVIRGHQTLLGQDPRGVAGEGIDSHLERLTYSLARPGREDLGGQKLTLEVHRSRRRRVAASSRML